LIERSVARRDEVARETKNTLFAAHRLSTWVSSPGVR
jgi:hypothetical protein